MKIRLKPRRPTRQQLAIIPGDLVVHTDPDGEKHKTIALSVPRRGGYYRKAAISHDVWSIELKGMFGFINLLNVEPAESGEE